MSAASSKSRSPIATGLSRRRFLGGTFLTSAAAGLSIVGMASAQAQKTSKAAAKYQDQPNGSQRCSGCRYFQRPNACQRVQGTISPNGWCVFWTAGASGRDYSY